MLIKDDIRLKGKYYQNKLLGMFLRFIFKIWQHHFYFFPFTIYINIYKLYSIFLSVHVLVYNHSLWTFMVLLPVLQVWVKLSLNDIFNIQEKKQVLSSFVLFLNSWPQAKAEIMTNQKMPTLKTETNENLF